jgi:hypothetical protein
MPYSYNGKQISERDARELIERTLPDPPAGASLSAEIDSYMQLLARHGSLILSGKSMEYFSDDSAISIANPGGSAITFSGPDYAIQRAATERRTRFYTTWSGAIFRVSAAIISSPKFALNLDAKGREVAINEAAAIVSEIVRRAGYPDHLAEDDPEMR